MASFSGFLSKEILSQMRKKFYSEAKNILAQNACVKADPNDVSISRRALETENHIFSHKIDFEGKPVTNQKSSGRCWMFAGLNVIRIPFMKHFNLDEFEFSQSYLFFWDKIERANHFLHNIVDSAQRGEAAEGRLVSFLLSSVAEDGGQWDMLVNLINRHGLVPKSHFPETFCSENAARMNILLRSKLREFAMHLRNLVNNRASKQKIQETILQQMEVIYRMVGICLGVPPETIIWEYYDKLKTYHKEDTVTPLAFYHQYVKPIFNVDDKVVLVNDPRPTSSYGRLYTVDYLGNMVGGRMILYNNQPADLIMKFCVASIKNNEPMWFGSDVSKRAAVKQGYLDVNVHDYNSTFDTDFQMTISKADKMIYGESCMTHAMVLTAVTLDKDELPMKFRIENSWGEDRGEKGYLICSDQWFREFVYEVVLDKKYIPQDVLDVFNQNPIVLPAWDPMGTVAQ